MRPHLTVEQRQLALRLKARGLSLREIGPQVGCSHQGVALIVRHVGRRPVRRDGWVPGPGRLRLADREEITLGLHAGESFTVDLYGHLVPEASGRARDALDRAFAPAAMCPQSAPVTP